EVVERVGRYHVIRARLGGGGFLRPRALDLFEVDPFALAPGFDRGDGGEQSVLHALERAVLRMACLALAVVQECQTPLGERTALAPAVAVVIDAGDEPAIGGSVDEGLERWIHGRRRVQQTIRTSSGWFSN